MAEKAVYLHSKPFAKCRVRFMRKDAQRLTAIFMPRVCLLLIRVQIYKQNPNDVAKRWEMFGFLKTFNRNDTIYCDFMADTREKFREMLNDIAERDGIKRFNRLVELTGISANTFTNIKKNEVKEVSTETFWKLNNAFQKRYNIKWFQGDSQYMLLADYLAAKQNNEYDIPSNDMRQQAIMQRAHDIQLKVLGHIVQEPSISPDHASDEDPRPHLPVWADALLGIISKQVAENEVLHAELKHSIAEVNEIKTQLSELLKNINK